MKSLEIQTIVKFLLREGISCCLKPLPQKQHNCDIMMHFKVFYYYDILSIFCCNGLLCLLRFLLNYTASNYFCATGCAKEI